MSNMDNIRLSQHFTLAEFCNLQKYPANVPTMQHVVNMTYGCHMLLEPARQAIGCPILINSGFRNADVNRRVGVSLVPSTFEWYVTTLSFPIQFKTGIIQILTF